MYPAIQTHNNIGLNGWLSRMWKKHKKRILQAAAAIIGGGVGLIIGAALEILITEPQKTTLSELETSIKNWINGSFGNWYVSKMEIFKNKTSLSQLRNQSLIDQINDALFEMAVLVKYYQHLSTTHTGIAADTYGTKSQVVQDALIDFVDFYVAALAKVGGRVYQNTTNVQTKNIPNAPDGTMNWNGQNYTIKIPVISRTQTISTPPPGDPSGDIIIAPTVTSNNDGAFNCLVPPCIKPDISNPNGGINTLPPVIPQVDYTKPIDDIAAQVAAQDGEKPLIQTSKNYNFWKILAAIWLGKEILKK